jgi:hypothetical protein
MRTGAQNWELFGYDMRQLGRYWLASWRDLLWTTDSPLRERLDELVLLSDETGIHYYQAGSPAAEGDSHCSAILLPDELFLCKTLQLPAAVEGELEAALAIEAGANSPFREDDTAWGWQVLERDGNTLTVVLAIVSLSTVMTYLGQHFDSHDLHAQEVWVDVAGTKIVVRGFGEQKREQRYRKRLIRCASLMLVAGLLVLVTVGVSTLGKKLELGQLEQMSEAVGREAARASRMRNSLVAANQTISAVNELIALYPNPHLELARLTHLLEDEASVVQFSMRGNEIRLRGRARDGSSVMQRLAEEADYREVTAPQAITRLGNSGLEQFYLDIRLAGGGAE